MKLISHQLQEGQTCIFIMFKAKTSDLLLCTVCCWVSENNVGNVSNYSKLIQWLIPLLKKRIRSLSLGKGLNRL